ncbi:TonB-dependent receptor [Planktosalinus lacus]|uniref:TonB-dependent receptor n=1 Tax=Planktosalinus lacus TaxID=1526573 RepID=A0A8J2VD56_9FLAO|nr:TonB-dependent receptor [Planktosalinus lacus]GGD98784.1 TonB-dependent receptor [Planktosalinus lacus]
MGINKGQNTFIKVIFILLCWSLPINAQTDDKIPLTEVLKNIEENHDVRFSYAQNDIDTITLLPPRSGLDINQLLEYLNNNTHLSFQQIDERYIAVSPAPVNVITLCGIILDAHTKQPLSGATIQVLNTSQATVTDLDGRFHIKNIPENAQLTIRYLGYETTQWPVSTFIEKPNCFQLQLQPKTDELQEVVLRDIFTKGISKTAEGSFNLNVDNFGSLPGLTEPDILQMIQSLPGIVSVDETVSNISIRGGTTDENLILWDDIKMYQNGHFFGLISGFNPYLTKEVSVFKNGTHARYGESVSGVVAMHSDDDFTQSHQLGIQLNMINFGTFAKIKVNDKLALHLSGRRTFTDIVESPAYKQLFDKVFQDTEITNLQNLAGTGSLSSDEEFFFYDFSFKAIYNATEKDRLRVNFLTINNSLNFTETFTTETIENSETSELDQNSLAGGISWERDWNPKLSTTALVYGTYYLLDASNLDIFSNQKFIQTNEVLETGTKIDLTQSFSRAYSLSAGYQFTETGIANKQEVNIPLFRNYVKNVLRTHAFYLSNALNLENSGTRITAGLRASYIPKFEELILEPRLNIHQKLGGGFALEGAYEQKSQTVTQRIDFQSDFLGVEKRRWVLANNNDVPISKSNQFSLNLLYQKNNWLLQLEGFSKKVTGITSANQAFQNQLQFVRINGEYKSDGIELIVNKKTKNWSFWTSYTFAENNYTFSQLEPETFPHNFDIRHKLTLASSYNINRLKLAGSINWHSGKPVSLPLSRNAIEIINGTPTIQYDIPNQARNDDYIRVDLSAEYDFKAGEKTEITVNAAVLNLTNRKNVLNTYFVVEDSDTSNPVINQVEQISLGITPNISVQILF